MGNIFLAMLGLTAIALIFGTFFGFLRGRNRAILRLVLIVVCAVLAIVLRGTITDLVMGIKVDGKPLKEMLFSLINSGETAMPQSLINIVFLIFICFYKYQLSQVKNEIISLNSSINDVQSETKKIHFSV